MLVVRLPIDLEKRLERLAKRRGRTRTDLAREAIIKRLGGLEKIYLAEDVRQSRGARSERGGRVAK